MSFCRFSVVESGVVERVGYRNIHQRIYTALAASSSGSCVLLGTFIWCCVLLLDDVMSWCMFEWRSGALARAQIYLSISLAILKPQGLRQPDLHYTSGRAEVNYYPRLWNMQTSIISPHLESHRCDKFYESPRPLRKLFTMPSLYY